MNPLLDSTTLALFDQIRPEHVEPAIDTLITQADAALQKVTASDFPAQWNTVTQTLELATERLSCAWGIVSHLNSVSDTPVLRAAYNATLPKVTAFWSRLGADSKLYAKYKAMDTSDLSAEQRQAYKNMMRDFLLGGAELTGNARERFMEIQEKQAALSQKFSENTLDATEAFSYYASEEEIQGVPEDVKHTARIAAQAQGRTGYKLNLQMPCYLPVMQYAHSSTLRYTLYRAYVTRASDQCDQINSQKSQTDNTPIIKELLMLRQEEATLLGYPHYGALSLAQKMAPSTERVIHFLRDLGGKARRFAEADLENLRSFAREQLNLHDPQAWDWIFISEKFKESHYAFSEQEVKQYFPLNRVLEGLFNIVQHLFGIVIRPDQAPVWNPQVKFYRIERFEDPGNPPQLLAQFYLDLHAREGKRSGAWMDSARTRWLRPDSGKVQTPIAHLVCNFGETTEVNGKKKPALLSHDEVITLFHEFGHGLHHMLTQVNELSVAGINGVEWDAVELPSQLMENFCWEWSVLQKITAHVETQAPLPRPLFEKMLAARNFQNGLQTLRQIEFSLFDMLLHTSHDSEYDFMPLLDKVRQEIAVIPTPPWNRTPNTFSHIFAGGYAAGYYSYKWAEVLSADAYAAFEETMSPDGTPDPETGRKYLRTILETGGSRPAMESFKAFRGREPQIDALLRHQGMLPARTNAVATP